jgi:hypothetical protein
MLAQMTKHDVTTYCLKHFLHSIPAPPRDEPLVDPGSSCQRAIRIQGKWAVRMGSGWNWLRIGFVCRQPSWNCVAKWRENTREGAAFAGDTQPYGNRWRRIPISAEGVGTALCLVLLVAAAQDAEELKNSYPNSQQTRVLLPASHFF